jgi:hypothetical protein
MANGVGAKGFGTKGLRTIGVCALLAAAGIGAAPGVALAQQGPAITVLKAPQDIATCLCLEQGVGQLRGEVDRQAATYTPMRQGVEQEAAALEAARGQVNTRNKRQVEEFRQRLVRLQEQENQLFTVAYPAYTGAVERYNQEAQRYNQSCSGKAYDPETLAQVRAKLSCVRQ